MIANSGVEVLEFTLPAKAAYLTHDTRTEYKQEKVNYGIDNCHFSQIIFCKGI